MKNIFKIAGIIAIVAAIGFSMAACDDDIIGGGSSLSGGSGGTFTLTGIPSQYNGKYAYLQGSSRDDIAAVVVTGCQDATRTPTPVRISNGTANIPMWQQTYGGYKGYYGNDTFAVVLVVICNSQNGIRNSESPLAEVMFYSSSTIVTFRNGSATKSWSSGYIVY